MNDAGLDALFIAFTAAVRSPDVLFLKPTATDSPDASDLWVWLSVVLAPIEDQDISSSVY